MSRWTRLQLAPLGVALVVRVVQALADLHDDVAGHARSAATSPLLRMRSKIDAQVAAVHVLEGDEEAVLDLTEVEDLGDVRVLQLHGDLRLVDEHRDELFVLGDVRQDALDGQQTLEPLDAECLGLEDLGHTSDVDPLEEVVLAERDGLLQLGHNTREIRYLQLHSRVCRLHFSRHFLHGPGRSATGAFLLSVSMKARVAPAATTGGATKTTNGIR